MQFEFTTKICNCSGLFDDTGVLLQDLTPAYLTGLNHIANRFLESQKYHL